MPKRETKTEPTKRKRCRFGHFDCDGKGCLNGLSVEWKPEYNEMIVEYFAKRCEKPVKVMVDDHGRPHPVINEDYPTFEEFAHSLNMTHKGILGWTTNEKCPGFSEAYAQAKQLQFNFLAKLGIAGGGNAGFIQFMLKNNHGMKDTQDHTNDGQAFGPTVIIDPSGEPFKFQK